MKRIFWGILMLMLVFGGGVAGVQADVVKGDRTYQGDVTFGRDGSGTSVAFEGTTDNAYETLLGALDPTRDNKVEMGNYSGSIPIVVGQMSTEAVHSAKISGVTGMKLTTPAAGWFTPGSTVKMTFNGTITGANGDKHIYFAIGGGGEDSAMSEGCIDLAIDAAATGDFHGQVYVHEYGALATQRIGGYVVVSGTTEIVDVANGTVNVNSGTTDIELFGYTANSGDTIFFRYGVIEYFHWLD